VEREDSKTGARHVHPESGDTRPTLETSRHSTDDIGLIEQCTYFPTQSTEIPLEQIPNGAHWSLGASLQWRSYRRAEHRAAAETDLPGFARARQVMRH
jgi:hypothetical protein